MWDWPMQGDPFHHDCIIPTSPSVSGHYPACSAAPCQARRTPEWRSDHILCLLIGPHWSKLMGRPDPRWYNQANDGRLVRYFTAILLQERESGCPFNDPSSTTITTTNPPPTPPLSLFSPLSLYSKSSFIQALSCFVFPPSIVLCPLVRMPPPSYLILNVRKHSSCPPPLAWVFAFSLVVIL